MKLINGRAIVTLAVTASPLLSGMASAAFTGTAANNRMIDGRLRHAFRKSSMSVFSSSDPYGGVTDKEFPSFETREEYLEYLSKASRLPQGFEVGCASGSFVPTEAPDMGELPIRGTLVYLPEGPSDCWTAVFTKNKFPGAPVHIGRQLLDSSQSLQALFINNKVSNVCSPTGIPDAQSVCEAVSSSLSLPLGPNSVLPSSTGVIGWRLPAKEIVATVLPPAVSTLQSDEALTLAVGIQTTDRWPKLRSKVLSSGARIVGCAKGAGMVEPNMATMLCFILTDAVVEGMEQPELKDMLKDSIDRSFNSISVDGDESTSDTCVLVSSKKIPTEEKELRLALTEICQGLSADVVRNGEGTSHVMRVVMTNYGNTLDPQTLRKLGRHICNSPLFKCAVAGNDPNVGRLAGAVGSFIGKLDDDVQQKMDVAKISFSIGGQVIFNRGMFDIDGEAEDKLSAHMEDAMFGDSEDFPRHQKFVELGVDFGIHAEDPVEDVVVLGSDLTKEYVAINADYRS